MFRKIDPYIPYYIWKLFWIFLMSDEIAGSCFHFSFFFRDREFL
jgi:hypothetical protein